MMHLYIGMINRIKYIYSYPECSAWVTNMSNLHKKLEIGKEKFAKKSVYDLKTIAW